MRKSLLMVVFVGISVIMATSYVFAKGTSDPHIQKMIEHQQERIDRGIESGELTRDEAKILQDNLQWIKDREAEFKAGGNLTDAERAELRRMLENNSEMIYNKKHNPVKQFRKVKEESLKEIIANQQKRIDKGVFSGALTLDEAKILQNNLEQIKSEEENLKANEKLTPAERARLKEKLELNSKMIHDKKHNPIKRF